MRFCLCIFESDTVKCDCPIQIVEVDEGIDQNLDLKPCLQQKTYLQGNSEDNAWTAENNMDADQMHIYHLSLHCLPYFSDLTDNFFLCKCNLRVVRPLFVHNSCKQVLTAAMLKQQLLHGDESLD